MLEWDDCKKILLARWIQLSDGSRISVKGSQHWATGLKVDAWSSSDEELEETESSGKGDFNNWETISRQGGRRFCYAAFDCGCIIQEKSLCLSRFQDDQVDLLMERVVKAGVQRLILKGNSIKKAARAKALAAFFPNLLRFSVGYHPDVAGAWKAEKLTTLEELATDPACVAIGECGIDISNRTILLDQQKELMKRQVELACQLRKPLLVYEYGAQQIVLDILKEFHDYLPPVVIRLRSDNCDFNLYIQHGCYIIVSGWLFAKDIIPPFYHWLRDAKPWQLDYLLLASGSDNTDTPVFVSKVLGSEFKHVILKISRNNYTKKAREWYEESCKQWRVSTPLFLPILIELTADGARLSPAELSYRCLENSKRFFQVVKRQEQLEMKIKKLGWERTSVRSLGCGWVVLIFLLPVTLSLTVWYIVGYLCV